MVVILGSDPDQITQYSVLIIDAKSWDLFTSVLGFAPSVQSS